MSNEQQNETRPVFRLHSSVEGVEEVREPVFPCEVQSKAGWWLNFREKPEDPDNSAGGWFKAGWARWRPSQPERAGSEAPTITNFEAERGDPVELPNAEESYTRLDLPPDLHEQTKYLVWGFACALASKLHKAEQKYGYSDGWRKTDWVKDGQCRQRLMDHIAKGDPRDVAAYCAFLWYHNASTAAPSTAEQEDKARLDWLESTEGYDGDKDHPYFRRARIVGGLLDDGAESIRAAIDAARQPSKE